MPETNTTPEPVHRGANPETCRHNVVAYGWGLLTPPETDFYCVSCDSPVSKETVEAKNYEFDIDYNVWVAPTRGRRGE